MFLTFLNYLFFAVIIFLVGVAYGGGYTIKRAEDLLKSKSTLPFYTRKDGTQVYLRAYKR